MSDFKSVTSNSHAVDQCKKTFIQTFKYAYKHPLNIWFRMFTCSGFSVVSDEFTAWCDMSLSHLKSSVFISARNFTFLWNLHHHKMLPLDPSLTHFNPGYFCTTYSSKINLNIPSDLKSPVWPLTLNIFQSKFCTVFVCCMPACYVDRVVFYLNMLIVLQ